MAEFIADLELHSRYSRAVSPQMLLPNMAAWAAKKGIRVIVTGDLTHPLWFRDIIEKLEPAEPGLFRLKTNEWPDGTKPTEVSFLLGGEVSCVYKKRGRVRRVHHLIYAPSLEAAKKINHHLGLIGNIRSDGRPILGLESKKLLEILLGASPNCMLIPAHVWTPWFGIFGSMSGYDSLQECFEELEPQIFAIETGLSSDPPMNWRIPFLDHKTIMSSSDSHSLIRMGREATIFNTEISYHSIRDALKTGDGRLVSTVEFFPAEGMYHYDGHRACDVVWSPEETKQHNFICPKCGRRVTVGVMSRIEELAAPDRSVGYQPPPAVRQIKPFYSFVALDEIIANALNQGKNTKAVWQEYDRAIHKLGSEFNILIYASALELRANLPPLIAEGVEKMRRGEVKIEPGYDGQYGKIKIFTDNDRKRPEPQTSLF